MWSATTNTSNFNASGGAGFFRQGAGATPSPSFTQGDKQQKRFRIQNLVPVTIAQIHKSMSEKGNLFLDDTEVSMVSIVGLVVSADQQTTHYVYEIDDMTGPIMKVQHWLDEQEDGSTTVSSRKPMVENTYVHVIGSVKKMRDTLHVVVFKISPVTDLNELTNHKLEVIYSRHMAENKLKQIEESEFKPDVSGDVTSNFESGDPSVPIGLSKAQAMVYKAIQSCVDASGCSMQSITESLKSFNVTSIRDAVSFLSDEGHIYSTVDDNHFKVTDSY